MKEGGWGDKAIKMWLGFDPGPFVAQPLVPWPIDWPLSIHGYKIVASCRVVRNVGRCLQSPFVSSP